MGALAALAVGLAIPARFWGQDLTRETGAAIQPLQDGRIPWIEERRAQLTSPQTSARKLQDWFDEAMLRSTGAMTPDAKATWLFFASDVQLQFAQRGISKKEHARHAFVALKSAAALAPSRIEIARATGRAVKVLTELSGAYKFFAKLVAHIDVDVEVDRAITLLSNRDFAKDALCQMLLANLVSYRIDHAAKDVRASLASLSAEVDARLDHIRATDPDSIASAKKLIAQDEVAAK
jgi:hypothetical protein